MVDLTPYNTLKVHASAKNFLELNTLPDIKKLDTREPFMLLGAGANVLFTKDFPGTVAKVNLRGRRVVKDTGSEVLIEAAAGENWHDLVMWTAKEGWSGMENMALIPGTVGAAVAGNIGAYGQNQGDLVDSVAVLDLNTHHPLTLSQQDCKFFYRESAFKHEFKNNYLITSVRYRLSKTAHFDTSYYSRYESLQTVLDKFATPPYTPSDVAQAVIKIRTLKMPDWTATPTAGSFFKNPFVTKARLAKLQSQIKELQFYPTEKMLYPHPDDPVFAHSDLVKIPAGRLLDELGWRGKRVGNVATFDKHALVIINLGGATGHDIYCYSQAMHQDVLQNFGIYLDYEVQVI